MPYKKSKTCPTCGKPIAWVSFYCRKHSPFSKKHCEHISQAIKGKPKLWLRGKKRPEHSKFLKNWWSEHLEEARKYDREYQYKIRQKVRQEAVAYYGGKCAKCGITDYRILQIDHIENNGYKHRKEIKTWQFPMWLKKNGYPKGYQILCCNCNWLKRVEDNDIKRGRVRNKKI